MQTFEEKQAFVQSLNMIDDVFFFKMVEDRDVCEEMLQVLLSMPTLRVVKHEPQRVLRNIGNKGVCLDLLCNDGTDTEFAVEMQKADDDDHIKRVRYIVSNLDTLATEQGTKYKDVPDIYAVYITKNDFLHGGKTVYHVEERLAETGQIVYNGINKIFINAKIDDGSDIAEYMNLIKHTNGHHKKFSKASNRAKFFKETPEGVNIMCDIVENYAKMKVDEATKKVTAEVTAKVTAEERIAGIRKLVSTCRELGAQDCDIVAKVAEKYNISQEAALAYM